MPARISVEVKGLREAQKRALDDMRALGGQPMVDAMRQATLVVMADARRRVPVDTGRLRASIVPEVEVHGHSVEGIVGSNVAYAPYMELGTRPHFPPVSALRIWARRHGVEALLVARAISRRGTRPRAFLMGAYVENEERVYRIIDEAAKDILERK